MSIIWIIVIIIVGLLLFELFKHEFKKGSNKWIIVIVILIFILMVISAYVDLSQFFEEDSAFVKTGNIVKNIIEKQSSNVKESNSSIIDKFKDSTGDVFNSE